MSKIAIVNIGKIVSGDLNRGVLEENDTIIVQDGKITEIGTKNDVDFRDVDKEVDVNGMVVMPGLMDSHVHPVIGDWTPRFKTVGYMTEILHSGVTTMISQGEIHVQGRPQDPSGIKALAILAKKTFENFRPGGVRVYGGALIPHPALSQRDFKELKNEGVWLTAEIGATPMAGTEELIPTVKLARKYGMKVMMHLGGKSIPGSATITADDVMKINPDVVSHVNGGPTAPSFDDVKRLVMESESAIEVVYGGNPKIAIETIKLATEKNALHKIIIGSDSPTTASGLGTCAIIRTIILISSLTDVTAEQAISMATGNTAKTFGLKEGKIEEDHVANLLVVDSPEGSVGIDGLAAIEAGDMPGIAMIMVEGKIVDLPTLIPPPRRSVTVI